MNIYVVCFGLGFACCFAILLAFELYQKYSQNNDLQKKLDTDENKLRSITVQDIRSRINSSSLDQLVSSDLTQGQSSTGNGSTPKR